MSDVIRKLGEIDEKIKRLKKKELLLKEKERKKQDRIIFDIGSLAKTAEIIDIEMDVLLGAFLEIKETANDKDKISKWKTRSSNFQKERDEMKGTPLAIIFPETPNDELKSKLKSLGFQWNRFRKEWYGHSSEHHLRKLLESNPHKIEKL
ncbi:conjugal transfer protein TraD [Chlamydiales bacterium]|nr:conjugal transfer protein TraD [Chlamydiales bacterium]